METEQYKSYLLTPSIHNVNVFHLYSGFCFFHISCTTCKLEHKCYDTKHKREICVVAQKIEKLLLPITIAKNYGFMSQDFCVVPKKKTNQEELKETLKFLRMKYIKKNAR